jgi:hypothetical protein
LGQVISLHNRERLTVLGVADSNNVDRDLSNVRVGNKIIIKGRIKYFQDFCTWEHEFGGLVFKVDEIVNNSLVLKAPGYGDKPYGNGVIVVFGGYLRKLLLVG